MVCTTLCRKQGYAIQILLLGEFLNSKSLYIACSKKNLISNIHVRFIEKVSNYAGFKADMEKGAQIKTMSTDIFENYDNVWTVEDNLLFFCKETSKK